MLPSKCPSCGYTPVSLTGDFASCPNCTKYFKQLNYFQKILVWASTKKWWLRAPILVWFGVLLVQNWQDPSFALERLANPLSAIDLGIHELGHFLFSPFGEFIYIAGGSLFQCVFPLITLVGFLQQRWYFAATMCWCWLGLNFFDVATYADDAQTRLIPLATGIAGLGQQRSEAAYDSAHDWYQLLSRTDHLQDAHLIAEILRIAGSTVMIFGLAVGTILVVYMFVSSVKKVRKPPVIDSNLT